MKPANVLLTRAGEPKIADFGLAKQLSSEVDVSGRFLTQPGVVVGTPEYMSPEQASGTTPTTAVDIYALGVILYELLTARVPFQGTNPVETMDLVRHQEAVAPRQLQPSIPRDLDTICLKCLEKDPNRRYVSADALADDLQRFLNHRAIQARRVSRIGKAQRWCRRNPVASVSLICVVSMFLTAFAIVSGSYWKEASAREEAIERARAEREENYFANIAATANALQVYNVDSARRTLDAAPEEHRNWEWRHFQSRLDLTAYVSETANPLFGRVTFSPSARYAIRWRGEHAHVLWDTTSRGDTASFQANGNFVLCNDERTIVSLLDNGSIAFDDVATGKTQIVLHQQTKPAISISASADGKRVVTYTSDRKVWIWNASNASCFQTFTTRDDILMGIRISHDNRWLVADQIAASTCRLGRGDRQAGLLLRTQERAVWVIL